MSRYAGISNKVSSFGIYEYKSSNEDELTENLIAQIIWYFIEGVNCRINDNDFTSLDDYEKYTASIDEYELIFHKNKISSRWWIKIPSETENNNFNEKHVITMYL